MNAATGLADLLRSLAVLPESERMLSAHWEAHANVLGLHADKDEPRTSPSDSSKTVARRTHAVPPQSPEVDLTPRVPVTPAELAPVLFWRAVEYHHRKPSDEQPTEPPPEPLTVAELRPQTKLPDQPSPPIEPWTRLWPRIATHLVTERRSRAIDTRTVITTLARARPLVRIPYRSRRAWAEWAVIVHDRGPLKERLIPDQVWVTRRLRRAMGRRALHARLLGSGPDKPSFSPEHCLEMDWPRVPPGTPLLALGSFRRGDQNEQPARQAQAWIALGARLQERGYRPAALVACPQSFAIPGLRQSWDILPWERHTWRLTITDDEHRERVERLLAMAAPALVVSSALLRELRLLLAADMADVGTEADVWSHPDVVRTDWGLFFSERNITHWLEEFAALPQQLRSDAWNLIRRHQSVYGSEVNHLSTWRLMAFSPSVVSHEQRRAATNFIRRANLPTEPLSADRTPDRVGQALRVWFRGVFPALSRPVIDHPELRADLSRLWYQSHGEHESPPAGLDPWQRPVDDDATPQDDLISHVHGGFSRDHTKSPVMHLSHVASTSPLMDGRPLSSLAVVPPAQTKFELASDLCRVHVERITKPPWAYDMGRDRYGLWMTEEIAGVFVRMRWIPPGRFLMGSPRDEPGRDDNEVQHEEVITRGFWLADTPCTQALWTAVMGENPSYFESPDRPVETVSFQQVQTFIEALARSLESSREPDARAFRLPTEVEWEYACRAGMEHATYAGPMKILGQNNAPILDRIAWYGGNSGERFELANGYNSSAWPEKQYPHQQAGTHRVAQLGCNPWGLYDMLGNVWEWCDTVYSSYADERTPARHEPVDERAGRVVRGGSWDDRARLVRAACRHWYHPVLAVAFSVSGWPEVSPVRSEQAAEQSVHMSGGARHGGRGTRPTAAGRMPAAPKKRHGGACVKLHFVTVPARDPGAAASELNAFLAGHRVVGVEKHLVGDPGSAYWAICVTYTDGPASTSTSSSSSSTGSRRGRIDYREVLDEQDFAVFAELRKLRKQFAESEGVPPYAVFNNEQLAAMVTRRVRTKAAFQAIEGVGPARIERYATAFLERLETLLSDLAPPEASHAPGHQDQPS